MSHEKLLTVYKNMPPVTFKINLKSPVQQGKVRGFYLFMPTNATIVTKYIVALNEPLTK